MPKQKDFKRLVRSRMKKTGESYTTARARITARKPKSYEPTPADLASIAGMSDEAVRAKTGRSWAQWVEVLDAIEATKMTHTQIASHVYDIHGMDGWWAQAVTVGYERIRGLRERGQRRDGAYECNKSRTYPAPVAALFEAFTSPRLRAKWLPGVALAVRKATPHKSARITWPDGTNIELYFLDKGTKSAVNVQHQKLPSREEAARLKTWWGERLQALADLLKE